MYRLVDGAYEVVEPLEKTCASEPDTVWSDVFDTHIRFLPDAREDAEEFCHLPTGHRPSPRFQWHDPEEGRWRDTETDAEQERDQAAQERTDMAIDMMREFLGAELESEHLDRIEEVWRGDGPPTDAARRVRTVLQSPPPHGAPCWGGACLTTTTAPIARLPRRADRQSSKNSR